MDRMSEKMRYWERSIVIKGIFAKTSEFGHLRKMIQSSCAWLSRARFFRICRNGSCTHTLATLHCQKSKKFKMTVGRVSHQRGSLSCLNLSISHWVSKPIVVIASRPTLPSSRTSGTGAATSHSAGRSGVGPLRRHQAGWKRSLLQSLRHLVFHRRQFCGAPA
jgi:hypothetical protein